MWELATCRVTIGCRIMCIKEWKPNSRVPSVALCLKQVRPNYDWYLRNLLFQCLLDHVCVILHRPNVSSICCTNIFLLNLCLLYNITAVWPYIFKVKSYCWSENKTIVLSTIQLIQVNSAMNLIFSALLMFLWLSAPDRSQWTGTKD